jgi:hypothetical protein
VEGRGMTDWIVNGEAGSSVRGKLNNLPNKGDVENLTSSSSAPVNADNTVSFTTVTSDGSAADQHVILPNISGSIGGEAPNRTGFRKVIYLAVQANASDRVLVFSNADNATITQHDTVNNQIAQITGGIVLDYEGASATFVWRDYLWEFDNTGDNNDLVYSTKAPVVDPTVASRPIFSILGSKTNGQTQWFNGFFIDRFNTAGPYTRDLDSNRNVASNEGTNAKTVFSLALNPSDHGQYFEFAVQDAHGIEIDAGAGATIYDGATPSSVGGSISSTTVGSYIGIQCINATTWFVKFKTGTWTLA